MRFRGRDFRDELVGTKEVEAKAVGTEDAVTEEVTLVDVEGREGVTTRGDVESAIVTRAG
jgi:hypothetical protein